jgi:diguanylate cyclase (GGDEF)-like protein
MHTEYFQRAGHLSRFRKVLAQPVVGFGVVMLCGIWLAVWHQLQIERTALEHDVAQDTANLALVLEQNVARTASEIDHLLKFLRRSYERTGFQGEWASLVKDEFTINDQTVQIAIIDARGMMVTSTAMLYPRIPIDLSDREHYRVHLKASRDELFISKPVVGRASGKWSVQFTRRFEGFDGNFGGVIVISLDPSHLSRAYGGLNLGDGSGLAVVGNDDIIRAGTGIYAESLGTRLTEGNRPTEVERSQGDTQFILSEWDGVQRKLAWRSVRGYPLSVVVAGRDLQYDGIWVGRQRKYLAGATVLSLLVLLALWVALRSRRRHEAELIHLGRHDALTNLPNRVQFREAMDCALTDLPEGRDFAVHLIDLDGFKYINDRHGHGLGDNVLKAVADRLRSAVRHCDMPARLGGDEFAVIQTKMKNENEAGELAKRLCAVLSEPYHIDELRIVIGCSIGIAVAKKDAVSTDLMRFADIALYSAKAEGRGTYRFYDEAMNASALARRSLEADLRLALEKQQLVLHYQPITAIDSREITGYEALLRWCHPERGLVSPAEFIPIAEETGLIVSLGKWVLQTACADMALCPAPLRVAVNVSAVQFKSANLMQVVRDSLESSGLDASRLEIEITESTLMQKDNITIKQLNELHALGVQLALDDFGTGYSSLSYLHSYPIHSIKIDRSFVSSLGEQQSAAPIVRAITTLASSLGMRTVAEGVETPEQLEQLAELGCTEAQGFHFSPPKPAAQILPRLADADKQGQALAA